MPVPGVPRTYGDNGTTGGREGSFSAGGSDKVSGPIRRGMCPRGENMRRLSGFLLMSILLPAGVSAQENRPYIVMSGLMLALVESEGTHSAGGETLSAEFDMDAGYGATLAFGFGAAPGASAEIEVGYRATDLARLQNVRVTNSPGATARVRGRFPVTGSLNTSSLMVNGYYTFDVRAFRPYVGAGVGVARHEWSNADRIVANSAGDILHYLPSTSNDDVAFAYQLMLGLNWVLADNMEARAGYRYFATTDVNFDGVEAGYATHNVDGGLIIRF